MRKSFKIGIIVILLLIAGVVSLLLYVRLRATAERRGMLFEPAGQIIFGLKIEQLLGQRFQLLSQEPFDLPPHFER